MSKKNSNISKKEYKTNLTKIVLETVLSSIGVAFSVSIITVFWNSIGMDQKAIGFVQMAFTISIFCLDIPMGYIADRFNRKVLNVIGDIGVAVAFFFYAFAQNIYMALISECLLGLFLAMTNIGIKLQLALVGVCTIFFPMCLISYLSIRKLEKV